MRYYTKNDLNQIGRAEGLSASQLAVITLLLQQPGLKSSQIMVKLDIASRQQLSRLINLILQNGIIVRSGKGPAVTYHVNRVVLAEKFMELDYLQRSVCGYDYERLEQYIPGKTFLLREDKRKQMRELSDATIQPGETLNDRIYKRLLIDFSWASSRMEGNTYTLGETEELIQKAVKSCKRSPYETLMVENHANAMRYLIGNANDIGISPLEIRGVHAMLSNGLLTNDSDCGAVRNSIIEIGQSAYHPESNQNSLTIQLTGICNKAAAISDPFEQSFFLMLHISYLQPFIDINKRTGRACANIPLLKNNLCPVSFYGIDEREYIAGILEFYETAEVHTISHAFLHSYKNSMDRYRRALSEVKSMAVDLFSNRILQKWIMDTVQNQDNAANLDTFIETELEKAQDQLSVRDMEGIHQKTTRLVDNLTEVRAIGAGVPLKIFKEYLTLQ